ncbi:MAG: GTP cyclohydrolase I FolE [Planctomycetes bacterium]|nr:GTP cyclohydrolase I FolE [Planctomycetota bacterium]
MDQDKIEKGVRFILEGLGRDITEGPIAETPARVARAYTEIFGGHSERAEDIIKVFHEEGYDEMVLVRDIPFYSMCEHHLLPFYGRAHVAYIPRGGRITGLSKLARVVEAHARRLQVQERMTADIAGDITRALNPKGVMVVIEAEHLCMTMRGIKKPGSISVTSVVTGIFRENPATRAEAMKLVESRR